MTAGRWRARRTTASARRAETASTRASRPGARRARRRRPPRRSAARAAEVGRRHLPCWCVWQVLLNTVFTARCATHPAPCAPALCARATTLFPHACTFQPPQLHSRDSLPSLGPLSLPHSLCLHASTLPHSPAAPTLSAFCCMSHSVRATLRKLKTCAVRCSARAAPTHSSVSTAAIDWNAIFTHSFWALLNAPNALSCKSVIDCFFFLERCVFLHAT